MEPVIWVDDMFGEPNPQRWAWDTTYQDWQGPGGCRRQVVFEGNEPSRAKALAAAQAAVPDVKRAWEALTAEGGE